MNQVLAAASLGPCKYIFSRFGPASKKVREQIFGLGRPAGHRAAAAGAFKKADPLGPKRLGSRESIHAGQSVPAPHLVPSRSLDRRLVCPGPSSGCPQCVRVRPGLMSRPFTVRCIGQRPDPLDEDPLDEGQPPDPFSSNRKTQRNSDLDFRFFAVSITEIHLKRC